MSKFLPFFILLCCQIKGFSQFSAVPYHTAGATYSQNFDSLPISGTVTLAGKGPHPLDQAPLSFTSLSGWQILHLSGNQSNTSFLTGTGSGTSSGIYSFGLSGNANRALGTLASGTGTYALGVVIENLTGSLLNKINIRLLATQWRKGGSGNINNWRFSYQTRQLNSIDTNQLIIDNRADLTSIHMTTGSATLNGHLSANQYTIQITLTDIVWKPGEKLILRWDDQDETGSDDAMAIDDFNFTATAEISAPIISKPTIDSIGTKIARIKTTINDKLSNTALKFEYDTTAQLQHPITIAHTVPNNIAAGSGNIKSTLLLNSLQPGKKYFIRAIATNSVGTTVSDTTSFSTIITKPEVRTDTVIREDFGIFKIEGRLLSDNGAPITEIGFCWQVNDTPLIENNRVPLSVQDSLLLVSLKDFPINATIFVRPYAINEKGIGYGKPLRFQSQVSIKSFTPLSTYSNQDTLLYQLNFHKPVDAIMDSHFSLNSIPPNDAKIILAQKQNDTTYLIKIKSGIKDAVIQPVLYRDEKQVPHILPISYEGSKTIFDKTPPEIVSVSIPNRSYKVKDTISLSILTKPDTTSFLLLEGSISGYPITQFRKQSDSIYSAISIITTGGMEIKSNEPHIIHIVIKDSANNKNNITSYKIIQDKDAIDHTRPLIKSLQSVERKKYRAGDTLHFAVISNESIECDTLFGKPLLSVTIGTRVRNPALVSLTDTSLQFSYIIQPDEFDADGIRIANSITLNNSIIRDPAGNLLMNNIPNTGIIPDLLIDATLPEVTGVTTPNGKLYGLNDTLSFDIFFSETVHIRNQQFPFLEIVLGNMVYEIPYSQGAPGNKLTFKTSVQKGMLDKNGIGLSNQLFNAKAVTDENDNPVVPFLKNIGALSSIDVDGIPPKWTDTISIQIPVCKKGNLTIDKFLQIEDEEKAGGLEWKILTPPKYGFISGLPFSSKQTTAIQEPKNIIYTNGFDHEQTDECVIQVSDGINAIIKQLKFHLFPEINKNNIHKNQIICSGTIPERIIGEVPFGGNGVYSYQWQMSTEDAKKSFHSLSINNHPSFQPGHLQQPSWFRRIVYSGGCVDTSDAVLIDVKTKGLWLGKQNNSWHTASNWCSASTPDLQTDVVIQTNGSWIQITDSAFCKSLQLLDQTRLLLSGILTYENAITGHQSIRSENGTLLAVGKNPQWLPGQVFENNQLDHLAFKGVELFLSDSLYLKQSLQLIKGKFFTQNFLVLDSAAIIMPSAGGTQLIDRVTKLFTSKNNWITNPFKESIQVFRNTENVHYTGNAYAIFTDPNYQQSGFDLLTLKKQSHLNKIFNWESIDKEQNQSLSVWNRSSSISRFIPFENKKRAHIRFLGHPIIGDEEISFVNITDTQYHLTGNPYIASILSKNIGRSAEIGHHFWIWDSSLSITGGYAAKAFEGNHILEPMQGFIIKSKKGSDASIRFSEQSKIIEPLADSIIDIIENRYQIALTFYKEDQLLDRFVLLHVDSASIRYDEDDAEKFFNRDYNLYSLSYDQIALAIDARSINTHTYIPLCIKTKATGTHSIQFNRVWLPRNTQLELHDLFTGNVIRIKQDSIYHFQVTSDTASTGERRFILRAPIPPVPQEEPIIIKLSPNPAQHQLTLYFKAYKPGHSFILIKNMDGQIRKKQILGQQQEGHFQVSLNGLLNGSYILEIHSGNKFSASTFIKL